jgi:predicted 3-demethylubiquinone-9 3-methyltransferase (glyoxalase superfamily)
MFQELTALKKTNATLAVKSQEALERSQYLMDNLQIANISLEQTNTELVEQNRALKASLDFQGQQTISLQTSAVQDAKNSKNRIVTIQIKGQEEIAQLLCKKRRLEDDIDVLRAELSTVIFHS